MASSDNPVDKLERLLELSGIVASPNSTRKNTYLASSALSAWAVFFLLAGTTAFCFEDSSIREKGEALQTFLSASAVANKMLTIRLQKYLWTNVIKETKLFWEEMSLDKKNSEIMKQLRSDIRRGTRTLICVYYLISFPALIGGRLLRTFLVSPEKRTMPVTIWDPFKSNTTGVLFWSRFFFYFLMFFIAVLLLGVLLMTIHQLTLLAQGEMMVLMRMLQEQNVDMKKCIQLHQRNLKLCKRLSDLFGWPMAITAVVTGIKVAARAFQLISGSSSRSFWILGVISLMTLFTTPYFHCTFGQNIIDSGEQLFRSAYQNEWYEMNTRDMKSLNLFLIRASYIETINFKGIMTFNMEQLGMTCRAAYSALTVLS